MTTIIDNSRAFSADARTLLAPFSGVAIELDAPTAVAEAFEQAGITDRDSYLAWVVEYKRIIADATQVQRSLRRQGDWEMSLRAGNKRLISRLILLRRASKIAAAMSRIKEDMAASA